MKISKKQKAFTLTELLVVVVIIGVLSAVALPKFNRVIETRRTGEAEEMMAAVRTEQEKRCSLDKNYLTELAGVNDFLPVPTTDNYAYELSGTGMAAASKAREYRLEMPSYKDGRLCCSGAYCENLNKNYPPCEELVARADFASGAECAGSAESAESEKSEEAKTCPGNSTRSCGCQNKGVQTRSCNMSSGVWGAWGACSVSDACECTGSKPEISQSCNTCGTQTREVTCDTGTGEWKTASWGTCSKTESECLTGCDETKRPADFVSDCGSCMEQNISYTCKEVSAGKWSWISVPQGCHLKEGAVCDGGKETRSCTLSSGPAAGRSGVETRTCSSCTWSDWSACQCKEGDSYSITIPGKQGTSYKRCFVCNDAGAYAEEACPEEEGSSSPSSEKEWRLEVSFTASISNINDCSGTVSSQNCRDLRCPGGGTLTSPASGKVCDGECNASTGGYYCYVPSSATLVTVNGVKNCQYTVKACREVER